MKSKNDEMGYVRVYRSTLEWNTINSDKTNDRFSAWVKILMYVNHADKKIKVFNQNIICERGCSYKTLKSWSEDFGWGTTKTKNFFNDLEKDGAIKIEILTQSDVLKKAKNNKTTLLALDKTTKSRKRMKLTVCNYDSYQYVVESKKGGDKTTKNRGDVTKQVILDKSNIKSISKDIPKSSSELPSSSKNNLLNGKESFHEVEKLGGKLFYQNGRLKSHAVEYDWGFSKDEEMNLIFSMWLEHRRVLKKPHTRGRDSIEYQFKELMKLSCGDIAKAYAIVDRSINKGWVGLFSLDGDKGSNALDEAKVTLSSLSNGDLLSKSNLSNFEDGDVLVVNFNSADEDVSESRIETRMTVKSIKSGLRLNRGEYIFVSMPN